MDKSAPRIAKGKIGVETREISFSRFTATGFHPTPFPPFTSPILTSFTEFHRSPFTSPLEIIATVATTHFNMAADEEFVPENAAEQSNAVDDEFVPENVAEQSNAPEDEFVPENAAEQSNTAEHTNAVEENDAAMESEGEEE
ncbi:hypothetical protein OROHE_017376 [Orobanche hederae]